MVLDRLRELQEADLQLRGLQHKKASHDRAAKVQVAQIARHQEQIEDLRGERLTARVATNEKELNVKQKRADIEKLRAQQMQIKDNRQFQALQNEIKFAQLAISKIEDDILSDLGDLEAIDTQIAEAEAALAREQQGLEDLKKQIEARKSDVDTEIEAHRRRRREIASALPGKVVDQFTRIADRLDGEALAPVIRQEDGGSFICGGCHMGLTQNTYVILAGHSDNLVACPNCTRILYLPGTGAARLRMDPYGEDA